MDSNFWAILLTAIITILTVFGGTWSYVRKIFSAIKETTDVGAAINNVSKTIDDALADNIFNPDEIELVKQKWLLVKKEVDEAKNAWQNIILRIFGKKGANFISNAYMKNYY